MPKQYDKKTFLEEFEKRITQKGFVWKVEKGDKKGIAKTTPTLMDLMEAIAEALSEILSNGDKPAKLVANSFKIGPSGQQLPVATKAPPGVNNVKADMTTDPSFFTWIETFHSLLQGTYPEPGQGSPSTFAIAMKSLISLKPKEIKAKIIEGSSKVSITI